MVRFVIHKNPPAPEPWATLPDGDDAEGGTETRPVAVVRRLSEVQPEDVRWLWPGRIAAGKLTLIAGHPGLGKSFLTVDLAARVTTGAAWPDGQGRAPRGSVVMLNCEDDAADTIRPRLDAAGGDPSRVVVLDGVREPDRPERGFDLAADLAAVADLLDATPDCRLVTIDPVSAYLGAADSHKNAEVRGLLAPLQALAARRGVAVVLVSHLNKAGGGGAMSRVSGSGAFVAAVRAAWAVSADPDAEDDPDARARRLLLPLKNNLAPDAGGLAFAVAGDPAAVAWESGTVTRDASAVLGAEFHPRRPDGGSDDAGDCAGWLSELLADAGGWMKTKEVNADGAAAGYTPKQLRTAREKVCQRPRTIGFRGPSWWGLKNAGDPPADAGTPQRCPNPASDAPSPERGTLGTSGAPLAPDLADGPDPPRKKKPTIRKAKRSRSRS